MWTNRKTSPASSRPVGFTIVELLVVISIIGILVSLLLPSLANAKKTALVVQCASNQRQVGIALNAYATERRSYPTPDGQANFDSTIVNNATIPAVWSGWSGYGTWSWNYTFGNYVWWVGATTQDQNWYNRKEFMCTATVARAATPSVTSSWAERSYNGADTINYGSVIQGQTYINPNSARNVTSPWYIYLHQYSYSTNTYDWWDFGWAGTDIADQVFGRNVGWYKEYQIASTDGLAYPIITGPRYNEAGRRRAMSTCPSNSVLPSGAPTWTLYEPHGNQPYAGQQNSRPTPDPEYRNYLYTDGSVAYISHN